MLERGSRCRDVLSRQGPTRHGRGADRHVHGGRVATINPRIGFARLQHGPHVGGEPRSRLCRDDARPADRLEIDLREFPAVVPATHEHIEGHMLARLGGFDQQSGCAPPDVDRYLLAYVRLVGHCEHDSRDLTAPLVHLRLRSNDEAGVRAPRNDDGGTTACGYARSTVALDQ